MRSPWRTAARRRDELVGPVLAAACGRWTREDVCSSTSEDALSSSREPRMRVERGRRALLPSVMRGEHSGPKTGGSRRSDARAADGREAAAAARAHLLVERRCDPLRGGSGSDRWARASTHNDTRPARPGEFAPADRPLSCPARGRWPRWPRTNRVPALCRSFARIYLRMITARLRRGHPRTRLLASCAPKASRVHPLTGHPASLAEATRVLAGEAGWTTRPELRLPGSKGFQGGAPRSRSNR